MTAWEILLLILASLVFLPVLSYLILKFGTVGYLRAKDRYNKQHKKPQG